VTIVALFIVTFGIAAFFLLPVKSLRPANAEARELYLKGRRLWDKRTPEAFQKAIPLFQQAIDLEPNYALAHAGLADCYAMLGEYQLIEAREAFPKAKAAAQRALQLDERLAEAHIMLGHVLNVYDWDFNAAEREFQRGLELKPDYPTAHQWYSHYLMSRQRYDEALTEIRRARALDPLSPIIATTEGSVLYHARRYDEAIASLRKTLEWEPGYPAALTYLAMAYTEKGEYDAALASYEQARARFGDDLLLPGLAYVNARAGNQDAARQLIARMQTVASKTRFSPIYWALVYAGVGEKELALKWLEQCRAEKNPWLRLLNADPRFATLLTDARFRRLLSDVREL
jgi:tetratricopeptide (TPR) repeat protein